MKKTGLMVSCAPGALAISSGAYAATAAAAATATTTSSSESSSTVSEIIVTAEKREQSIQTVPVAITAFGAQDRNLKGISTVQDMTDFTPGFTYSSQLDRPVMRGVARNNNIYTSDSAVAVYLDDFYSNSTFFISRDDMLIDRVEIDLGPQGTLYGRNAIGGLINTTSASGRPMSGRANSARSSATTVSSRPRARYRVRSPTTSRSVSASTTSIRVAVTTPTSPRACRVPATSATIPIWISSWSTRTTRTHTLGSTSPAGASTTTGAAPAIWSSP